MEIGDAVVWVNVKRFGNKAELSKMQGVITEINGDNATIACTGYAAKVVTVALNRLKLKSQDTPMSLLEFARQNFGIGASQGDER